MILIDNLHKYFTNEFDLSELDSIKLRYSLELIISDLSKCIILLVLFSILGKTPDYVYSLLALLMIRSFTGGLHFKKYIGCMIFTGLFFCISILLKTHISLNFTVLSTLFIFSSFTIIYFAPLCHKSRPNYSNQKRNKFKLISIILLSFHFISCFFASKNPYLINSVWVMSLQSFQILIAKGVNIYEKRKLNLKKTT
jgi:accessory gene regulator B